MVTLALCPAWAQGVSPVPCSPHTVPLSLCPQPGHDIPGAHGLGGEGLPAETPRGQHHERQVPGCTLQLFALTHNLFFPLNSVPGIPAAGRVKLLSLTFASVINCCSKLAGEEAERDVELSLEGSWCGLGVNKVLAPRGV